MASEDILELVRNRSSPAVVILDLHNRLLYASKEALTLLGGRAEVPAVVRQLCDRVRRTSGSESAGTLSGAECGLFWDGGDTPYSLRAFSIGTHENGRPRSHVMVLIEKVVEKRALNLKKAQTTFGLSSREIEVVILVAQGLSNKEIACRLFLSEHTVKDHLKNIMRKLNASSRSEIIAILK